MRRLLAGEEFVLRIDDEGKFLYLELQGIRNVKSARETNPNFMNGVPELLILRLLQQAEMYGYEIVQAIQSQTGGIIAVGEGVVYPVLHSLERTRALTARRKTVGGRSRIYYSLTASGSRRFADLAKNWTDLTAAILQMLNGDRHEALS